MNSTLMALISLGDSTIAFGALLAGTGYLALNRNIKAAAILFLAVVAAGAAIGILKTLFITCDFYIRAIDVRFPSGHATLSAAGLGTIAVLIASRLIGWRRTAVLIGFAVVEAIIATTLVVMGFHTFYEVVVGLIVGGCAVVGAYGATRIAPPGPINLKGFLLSIASVVVLIHVTQVPSRDMASILAVVVQSETSVCRSADLPASRASPKLRREASIGAESPLPISGEDEN